MTRSRTDAAALADTAAFADAAALAGADAGKTTTARTRTAVYAGALISLALVFGYVETFIPIPLPGVRLGLANIAILIALELLPLREAAGVAFLKVLATGLLFGSPLTFVYALAGTALSFAVMALLARSRRISITAISCTGALFHNAGQLLVAQAMLGTAIVWAYAPLMAVAALATGFLTGKIAERALDAFANGSGEGKLGEADEAGEAPAGETAATAAAAATAASLPDTLALPTIPGLSGTESVLTRVPVGVKLLVLLLVTFVLFQSSSPAVWAACVALSVLFAALARINSARMLRRGAPLLVLGLLSALLQAALTPGGETLLALGPLTITQTGLLSGTSTLARLVCPVLLSAAFAASTPATQLLSALQAFLAPFARAGVRTDNLFSVLSVAFTLLPLHVAEADRLREARQRAVSTDAGGEATSRLRLVSTFVVRALREAETLAQEPDAAPRSETTDESEG